MGTKVFRYFVVCACLIGAATYAANDPTKKEKSPSPSSAEQAAAAKSALPAPSTAAQIPDDGMNDTPAPSATTGTHSAFPGGWTGAIGIMHNNHTLYPQASVITVGSKSRVVATTSEDWVVEPMVAYHWYFAHTIYYQDGSTYTECTITVAGACLGAFLAGGLGTASSASKTVDAIGFGPIIGWGGSPCDVENRTFNVGFMWAKRLGASTLADGYVPGQPPPAGQTSVLYAKHDVGVKGLFFSYTWGVQQQCNNITPRTEPTGASTKPKPAVAG